MEDPENSLTVHLLGQFRLNLGDQPISGLEKPRLQALLGYLIANRQAPVPRSSLAFSFWPDSPEAQALTNLRHLLHRLHRAWPDSKSYLIVDQRTIWWHPQAPWSCDLAAFDELILRAGAAKDEQQERLVLTQAIEVYRGEFLAGLYEDWILETREHIEEHHRAALERLVALLENAGDFSRAIHHAELLLKLDPLNEAIYRWLMHLHCRNADRSAALHVYHQCSRILQRELGVQPGGLTQTIYEQVLREPVTSLIPLITTGEFDPPLVGRMAQWRAILACWRGVATGNFLSHCVLISGEAGIGKTSLVQSIVDWVQRQGDTAALACCYSNERALPYTPVISWLNSFSLTGLPETWLRELARLSPELVDTPKPDAQIHDAGQRQRLFLALAHATLLQNQPILLVLDDAHWADRDSLEWLLFLLRHNPRARLMVILTQHSGKTGSNGSLSQIYRELQRDSRLTEITLERLDRSDASSLAVQLVGRPLAESTLDVLFEFSEGNPFFIVEAIRAHGLALGDTEQIELANIKNSLRKLTSPMQALLSSRLADLSPTAEPILETAAVIGRSFRVDTILLAGCIGEDILLNSLDELWRRGLILERDQQRYDFEHELLRQFVYDRMSYSRRRYLHRRVAEALQKVYERDLDPICAELAHHFEVAGVLLEAARFFKQAFKVAQRLYSNQDAIAFSEKALNFFKQLAEVAESETTRREVLRAQIEILCERDWNWRLMGKMTAIQNDLNSLLELNRQFADTGLAARIARGQASLHYRYCRLMDAHQEAMQGIALSKQIGDRLNEAYCYQILGRTLRAQGQYNDGLSALREALTIFQEINNPIQQVHCLSYISTLHLMQQDWRSALRVAEESLLYCEQAGLTAQRRFALGDMGAASIGSGNLDNAESWLNESLALARELNDRTQETFSLGHLGWLRMRQGYYSLALKSFKDAYELAVQSELHHYQSWLLSGLCLACARNEDMKLAFTYGERALRLAQDYSLTYETSLAKQVLDQLTWSRNR